MTTPLRTLTCALAVAGAVAAAPVSASPGLQRAAGGPGAGATLKNGLLTMHWPGGSARIRVPHDYLLPTVTTRGELGGVSFSGRTVVLTYARQGEGGRSRFLVAEDGKLTPLTFRGTVTFDAVAPSGSAIYLTRRASATDATRYKVLAYNRLDHTLNPVVTKVVFSAEGSEQPNGWTMQGQPLTRTSPRTEAGRTRCTTRASTPSSTRCRWGRVRGPPASSSRRRGAAARARCGCGRLRGTRSRSLSAGGAVIATADLTNWKLSLAQAATS